jgi:hypothetical protein
METVHGPEGFATFYIGNKREEAYAIFQQLKGSDDVNEKNFL